MLQLNVNDITPDSPLVIDSPEKLKDVCIQWLGSLGLVGTKQEAEQKELNTRGAKKYVIEKGHHVKSHVAFHNLMSEYGIVPKRRGREDWWQVDQLNKVPNKY